MKICPQCNLAYPREVEECPSDRAPLVEAEEWPEDTMIDGKYEILGKISQDIACTVYKALLPKRRQFRVLKVMNRHLASSPGVVKHFKRVADQLMKLRHAHVAQVESIDKTPSGLPFIVMEYPDGQSLQELIQKEAPFAPFRATAIIKQIAAGLEAGHDRGMIHRELKPESIVVLSGRGKDKIKLLGFGDSQLKEFLVGDKFRTSPDTVIGAFQYLSPEQALGRASKDVDGRTDLYSLGVLLYQMLTHELPFKAVHASDFMIAHIQGTPIPIRVAHADLGIPDILNALVMHCLLKDPKERPPDARDFIREVEYVEKEIKKGRGNTLPGPGNRRQA
ncbi:MAG: serine/threonine protein kinase [Terriglobia bacterium]